MRTSTIHIEKYRVRTGRMASQISDGMNGAFMLDVLGEKIAAVVSNGRDWKESGLLGIEWEHVSVSHRRRVPTWYEMQAVKELFWEDSELVIQFHVPKSDHINIHENVLHLWKPVGFTVPLPPGECV
jgi:hypothetical protein